MTSIRLSRELMKMSNKKKSRAEEMKSKKIVGEVIKKLIITSVSDSSASNREIILSSFEPIFDDFLAQTENLRIFALFLYDEFYKIREIAINIIGRLKKRNPAEINPFLRDLLLKLLSEIGFFFTFLKKKENLTKKKKK